MKYFPPIATNTEVNLTVKNDETLVIPCAVRILIEFFQLYSQFKWGYIVLASPTKPQDCIKSNTNLQMVFNQLKVSEQNHRKFSDELKV